MTASASEEESSKEEKFTEDEESSDEYDKGQEMESDDESDAGEESDGDSSTEDEVSEKVAKKMDIIDMYLDSSEESSDESGAESEFGGKKKNATTNQSTMEVPSSKPPDNPMPSADTEVITIEIPNTKEKIGLNITCARRTARDDACRFNF